ncbi:MAG: hypothetical protein GY730_08955, partial [bacterium]|nr:hypothetical protein [bacterium]
MKKKDSNLKVIYLAHHGLGDVITKIPAINYLISKFSRKNVFLTVQYQFIIDFISKYLHIPEKNFILFDRQNNNFSDDFSDYLKFIRFIRRQKFDYYILPPTINQKLGRWLYY